MQVKILGSSPDEPRSRHYASSYLVNGCISIDAGTVGFAGTPQEQARVRHIFLTHSHMDHIASLPVFLENAWDPAEPAVVLHALPETLEALASHVFNGTIWPDFFHLEMPGRPFVEVRALEPERAVEVEGVSVTAVRVDHTVPAVGFVVTDGRSTAVFSGDTGPTERLWAVARASAGAKTVFLECTFPDSMEKLAAISGHLTPRMFAGEVRKMGAVERVYAVHLKHRQRHELEDELAGLGLAAVRVAEGETEYTV